MVSKVIAQSGSALAEWAVIMDKYRAQNTSRVFAKTLGCGIESNWKLVECLYSRTFYKLANVELKPDIGMFPWAPVFDANFRVPRDNWYDHWKASDWRFFVETPEESIKAGRFNTYLSYMSGVTTQEAAYILREPIYLFSSSNFTEIIENIDTNYRPKYYTCRKSVRN